MTYCHCQHTGVSDAAYRAHDHPGWKNHWLAFTLVVQINLLEHQATTGNILARRVVMEIIKELFSTSMAVSATESTSSYSHEAETSVPLSQTR